MRDLNVLAIALLALVGCAAPGVERRTRTLPSIGPVGRTTVVLAPMGRPQIAIGFGAPQVPLLSAESEVRRLDLVERGLLDLHTRSGAWDRVVVSEDLGPTGVEGDAFLVSYQVNTFQENFDGPEGRYWVAFILGSLTAGLGWLIAIDSRANFTHLYEFDVRVHDVRGAPMVRVTMPDGSLRNVYDTSGAAPVFRSTYTSELHSWIGAGGAPGGRDLDEYLRAQAEEVARTMYALSVEDVARAIARASRDAPRSTAPVVTAGGESPFGAGPGPLGN